MDYFTLSGRSCENLKFCFPAQSAYLDVRTETPCSVLVGLKVFQEVAKFFFSSKYVIRQIDGKIKVFATSSWKGKIIHKRF